MTWSAAESSWAPPGTAAAPDEGHLSADASAPVRPRSSAYKPRRSQSAASEIFGSAGLLQPGVEGAEGVPRLSLRPMTTADVLDGAFTLIKARPAKLLGLTLALVAPIQVLVAFLQRNALGSTSTMEAIFGQSGLTPANEEAQEAMVSGIWIAAITIVGNGLVLVAVAAMIAAMLASWVSGHDMSAGQMLWLACRRSWALVISWIIVHIAEAAGLLGIYIGALFVMPLFMVVAPAIGAEGAGPLAAIARSARLCGRSYWAVMLWALLISVVGTIVSFALALIPSLAAAFLGHDTAWPLLAVGGALGATVETAFVAAATVLVYLNLRMRTEGIDLELSVREVFAEPSAPVPMVRP